MIEQVNQFVNTYLFGYKPIFGVVALITTYALTKFIPTIASKLLEDYSQIKALFQGTFRVVLWVTGILISLSFFGVDVSSIVAGLGLIGFGVGIALKDMVTNIISGIMIMLYSPFEKGDRVEVGGYKGTVRWIDLRYTTLYKLEGEGMGENDIAEIPNASLFTETVVVREKANKLDDFISSRRDGERL